MWAVSSATLFWLVTRVTAAGWRRVCVYCNKHPRIRWVLTACGHWFLLFSLFMMVCKFLGNIWRNQSTKLLYSWDLVVFHIFECPFIWRLNKRTTASVYIAVERSSFLMLALSIPCWFSTENRFDMVSRTHTDIKTHIQYTVCTPTHKHT